MSTTLKPIDPFANEAPGFNHDAATEVYETIMRMDDDAAEVYASMLVGSAFQYDQERYGSAIEDALRDRVETDGPAIKEGLVRSFVAKRAAGEDVSAVVAASVELSKAFDSTDFSPQERAKRAHAQQRDLATGQFVTSHKRISYATDNEGRPLKPARDDQARAFGVTPPDSSKLTTRQRSEYQQAYRQVAGLVSGFSHHLPAGDDEPRAYLHLQYSTGKPEVTPLPPAGGVQLDAKRRLVGASVSVLPAGAETDHSTAYEALQGLHAQYSDPATGQTHIDRFNTQRAEGDPFMPGSGLFARLNASSTLLDQTFRDSEGKSTVPKKAQTAFKTGQLVGTYGPEAQKVIAPAADRAAYRYRGTERATPDRRLAAAVESIRRDPRLPPQAKRDVMVRGTETETGWQPSGVLHYFRNLLPNADLNTLQLRSGTVPPSQGVILDKTGKIASQAVGYGDDWYLPFDLRHLKALKGGEYLRTRTWGGPSTEDIYTGLISGAKSISVVSHNGVYNVEFDPSFKGSRRYNDKAARMVARYGHLLDAVKSGQVTTGGIDPTRIAEIEADAEASYDPVTESSQYREEVQRKLAAEERNPTFSAQQRAEAGQRFLDDEALKHRTPDGHEMTRTELVDDWLDGQAREQYKAYRELEQDPGESSRLGQHTVVAPNMTLGDIKRQVAERNGLNDADPARFSANAVRAMGLEEHYNRYVEREEQTYQASLRPLALNGAGYQLALDALQEQFPYYISRVEFHPWTDAKRGVDTGYVKPKHNRPAEALAGFFDRTINGTGKVHADSIRGQGADSKLALRPYRTPSERVAQIREKRDGITPDGAKRELTPAVAREVRNQADLAALKAIKAPGARYARELGLTGDKAGFNAAGGKELSEHRNDLRTVNRDLFDLLETPQSELEAMQSTPEGAQRLHDRIAVALPLVDVDEATTKAFRNEGKEAAPAKFDRADVGTALRNLGTDRDFGSRAYEAGHVQDPKAVADTYSANEMIKRGVSTLGLAPGLADTDFADRLKLATDGVSLRWDKLVDWERRGVGPKPPASDKLPADVETLARASQLRRRYDDSVKRVAEAETIDATGGGQAITISLVNADGSPAIGFQPPSAQAGGPPTLKRREDMDFDVDDWNTRLQS